VDSTNRPAVSNCPECGAPIKAGAKTCWLCASKRDAQTESADKPTDQIRERAAAMNPYASPAPLHDNLDRTFSLSTMFLWTTLAAIISGLAAMNLALGISALILSLPAAWLTIGAVMRRKHQTGKSMTTPDKVGTFFAGLAISLGAAVGGAIAFGAVCFPIGLVGFENESAMAFAFIAGGVAGVLVWLCLVWLLSRTLRE
jgi:hypothetical protein